MFSNYTLAVFCMLYFLYAFFPASNNQSPNALEPPESLYDIKFNTSDVYAEVFDRIIIVVIDALRYDFVASSNMPFTVKTSQNNGCEALVKVESPTVTLPRIKALTTGSVPQFIDILFNLFSTESFKDSIIHRAVSKGKRIVFYGDDTWLKIYPNAFVRSEGTSSFYVNDYTEVDVNVTRNVDKELRNNDWDIMILHYLGLDHIGHISGPFSPLVQPKLKEMDDVINSIYESVMYSDRKTLILITGDHGMKDSGGHGGTTYSETRVPLVLLGGKPCKNDSISQVDIPVSLSALMGLTLPAESIGKVAVNLLDAFYTPEKLLYILRYNVLALQSKANLCSTIENISVLHHTFLKDNNDPALYEQVRESYLLCINEISDHLLHNSVEQNEVILIISCVAVTFCFCLNTSATLNGSKSNQTTQILGKLIIVTSLSLSYLNRLDFLIVGILGLLVLIILGNCLLEIVKSLIATNVTLNVLLIFGCVLHSISLTSSSLIEEEHQIWYFFMSTFLVFKAVSTVKKSLGFSRQNVFLLIGLRFLRKLNQTGDKWAFLPDISDWLLLEENTVYLKVFFVSSVISVLLCCKKHLATDRTQSFLLYLIFFSICTLKILDVRDYFSAQIIWCLILINIIVNLKAGTLMQSITLNWVLVSCLLLRPYNIMLVAYCIYASSVFCNQIKNASVLVVTHLWLGNVLFFCQGHSNSLASVDIASGYVGLESYKPVIVTLLVLFHTYSLPVLAHLLLAQRVASSVLWKHILSYRLLIVAVITFTVYLQRHHLFVWTVFAPKLLIESSHSIILLVIIALYSIMKFARCVVHNFLGNKNFD